jgi:hypothetical protein
MNRNECLMAVCALALAVGVGQAQEKQTKPTPKPAPPVLYIPPIPPAPELALELAGLEAVGCKVCAQQVQAAEAKGTYCTGCEGCATAKPGECCGECVKSKRDRFATEGYEIVPVVKKSKKIKKNAVQEYFIVAPPPVPPIPSQFTPNVVYTPAHPMPIATTSSVILAAPAAEPIMVFRAASKTKSVSCGGCDTQVQQAKHETHGSITFGLGITRTGYVVSGLEVKTQGELEIECGSGCVAKCDRMTLNMPGAKEWTITAIGKQVVISGPSLQATCDSLARSNCEGGTCFMLQGHVHLHHGKNGMKADVESEQVRLVVHGGMVEVHTVTAP